MLKRKNEENTEEQDTASKRVALDATAVSTDTGSLPGSCSDISSSSSSNANSTAAISKENHNNQENIPIANNDPTYVHFRMLCQVQEAALVVGKGGERIHHIKQAAAVRVNVSENIRGVSERVVHVRGPAEGVAKAFGLIARAVVSEPEGTPSSPDSRVFVLRLLVPHQLVGYVIGRAGARFREIEESSAAKLSASPHSMPLSTDRCLSVSGVADAIHIATYYVAQTILEHSSLLKASKVIFYNPATAAESSTHSSNTAQPLHHSLPQNPLLLNYYNQPQFLPYSAPRFARNAGMNSMGNININAQHQASFGIPITPIQLNPNQIVEQILIPNEYVGNVIGKSGKNIKQIKETSGSKIQISDPDLNSKNRKITVIGSSAGNQTAIFLINNRIEIDKKNNEAKLKHNAQLS